MIGRRIRPDVTQRTGPESGGVGADQASAEGVAPRAGVAASSSVPKRR